MVTKARNPGDSRVPESGRFHFGERHVQRHLGDPIGQINRVDRDLRIVENKLGHVQSSAL